MFLIFLLNDEFRDNQIIIASIFKYSRFDVDELIEIKEIYLNNKNFLESKVTT